MSLGKTIRKDSSGRCLDPHTLYKPYRVIKDGRELSIVFRDRVLSDLIGFVYSKWDADKAADDFMERLLHIRGSLGASVNSSLVTVVLDGENVWEHYKNDGNDFLNALYSKMSGSHLIKAVTISEYLAGNEPGEELPRLFAGSWINHNFKIWIGHHEDNTAWEHLTQARDILVSFENNIREKNKKLSREAALKLKQAWDEIYAAEGSDWFWWYGEDHSSMNDVEFDELFRSHLKKLYLLLDMEPPANLDIPIISEEKVYEPAARPTAFITPVIDGEITNYFEWLSSGIIEVSEGGSAMHRDKKGGSIVASVNYGFNLSSLFFRLDFIKGIIQAEIKWSFIINLFYPKDYKIEVRLDGFNAAAARILEKEKDGKWAVKADEMDIAVKDVVELAVEFDKLGFKSGDEIRFFITMGASGFISERWPTKGYISEKVPDKDFELYNWRV